MTPELLQQAVREFKEIYKEEFEVELSDQEATEKAIALLQLFQSLTNDRERSL